MPSPLTAVAGFPEAMPGLARDVGTDADSLPVFDELLAQADTSLQASSLPLFRQGNAKDAVMETDSSTPAACLTVLMAMGLGAADVRAIANASPAALGDDALRVLLAGAGLSAEEITRVLEDPSLAGTLRIRCVTAVAGFLDGADAVPGGQPSPVSGPGTDPAAVNNPPSGFRDKSVSPLPLQGAVGSDEGTAFHGNPVDELGARIARVLASAVYPVVRSTPTVLDPIPATGSGAMAAQEEPAAAVAGAAEAGAGFLLDEALDALENTLDVPPDTLRDLAVETDPQPRQAALDLATERIAAFLQRHSGQEMPARIVHALGLLKGILTKDEFTALEKAVATSGQTLPAAVPGPTVDRGLFESLMARLGEDVTAMADVTRREVMDQVRQAVFTLSRTHEGNMIIRVHPPMLGRVDIDVSFEQGGITATFKADQPLTRDIIQQNLNLLRDTLADHGIKAAQFVVTSENFSAPNRQGAPAWSMHDAPGDGSHGRGQGGGQDSPGTWRKKDKDGDPYAAPDGYVGGYGLDVIA